MEPVSHIAADSIESVDNLKVEVLSPKKTCTQLTEICMSSNNTISLLIPDANVSLVILKFNLGIQWFLPP